MRFDEASGRLVYGQRECRSGMCPICDYEELEYGDRESYDECIETEWTCPGCGAEGKEYDELKFDCHIVNQLPDTLPKKRVYKDDAGDLYYLRDVNGKGYRAFCRVVSTLNAKRQERPLRLFPYITDYAIAQYRLDALARLRKFEEVSDEDEQNA